MGEGNDRVNFGSFQAASAKSPPDVNRRQSVIKLRFEKNSKIDYTTGMMT